MLFPKIRRLLSAMLSAVCLTGFTTLADETSPEASTNAPAALRTLIRNEEVLNATNAKPIRRAYFSSGTNRFAFVVPGDFKLDASNPGKIILTSPDYSGFIAVQLVNSASSEAGGMLVQSFRNLAADEFPSGNIVGEFGMRAANQSGPGYEFAWKNSEGSQQQACVGFVPSAAGFLKFSLLSSSEKYSENQMSFRCLLRSFQSNEDGKLEILPVSGAS
jgi:hypothetical protein